MVSILLPIVVSTLLEILIVQQVAKDPLDDLVEFQPFLRF